MQRQNRRLHVTVFDVFQVGLSIANNSFEKTR